MGMFDYVTCKYPLPEATASIQEGEFQTKAFGDGYSGGFMEHYTITEEGKLVYHKTIWDFVPEEERPYWGKPEWDTNPLVQVFGSVKSKWVGDEILEYHGIVEIYTMDDDTDEWFEYEIKFTDGVVAGIKRIYREFG